LSGKAPDRDPSALEKLRPRSRKQLRGGGVEAIRAKLAANPEDLESLQALGSRYLKAGDFHAARLVLARAAEAGGGPEVVNALGLASAQAGDTSGAMESFGRAAEGGLDAGHYNLAAMFQKAGLTKLAQETRARAKSTPSADQLLPSARRGGR
jgi:Flp pilus assembly protein TadD